MGIFLQIHTGEAEGKRRENGWVAGEVRLLQGMPQEGSG